MRNQWYIEQINANCNLRARVRKLFKTLSIDNLWWFGLLRSDFPEAVNDLHVVVLDFSKP